MLTDIGLGPSRNSHPYKWSDRNRTGLSKNRLQRSLKINEFEKERWTLKGIDAFRCSEISLPEIKVNLQRIYDS